jgi:hypothetical protein
MASKMLLTHVTFDSPARYEIRVKGKISKSWAERLEGMQLNQFAREEGEAICTLEGELLDQAALFGVLNTLYGLQLSILSVKCLSTDD